MGKGDGAEENLKMKDTQCREEGLHKIGGLRTVCQLCFYRESTVTSIAKNVFIYCCWTIQNVWTEATMAATIHELQSVLLGCSYGIWTE